MIRVDESTNKIVLAIRCSLSQVGKEYLRRRGLLVLTVVFSHMDTTRPQASFSLHDLTVVRIVIVLLLMARDWWGQRYGTAYLCLIKRTSVLAASRSVVLGEC